MNINLNNVTAIRVESGNKSMTIVRNNDDSLISSFSCAGFYAPEYKAIEMILDRFGGSCNIMLYVGDDQRVLLSYWSYRLDELYV